MQAALVNYGAIKANAEIVSLARAKENSNITYNDEDTLLQSFLDAIAYAIENFIGAPVLERDEVTVKLQGWRTPFAVPVLFNEITSITYRNDSNEQVPFVVDEEYEVFGNELSFYIDRPSAYRGPITIKGTAGYANAAIPPDIQDAALLLFSERETFRENRPVKLNTSAQAMLRPYKRY